MFSYRHAFHAGNHADVLKHLTLIAVVRHLMKKEPAIQFVDTHAGAGIYRLHGEWADKSGEAADGFLKLAAHAQTDWPEALRDYLEVVQSFNPQGGAHHYPGSPFVVWHLMQASERVASRDRLKLFEMHPTDQKLLRQNIEVLAATRGVSARSVQMQMGDGFESLKSLLPPPASSGNSRRACVLIDPSYEIKNDYGRVQDAVQDALKRFPTGTYLVWYPIVGRPEAHDLPRRLKNISQAAGKTWLHASLSIGRAAGESGGLSASGMFVVNPPFTLKDQLKACLPVLLETLGRGVGQAQTLEVGG
ncbi:MAG: Ribosomal large subunit methyltransferase [Pseudomonadota bacterium]